MISLYVTDVGTTLRNSLCTLRGCPVTSRTILLSPRVAASNSQEDFNFSYAHGGGKVHGRWLTASDVRRLLFTLMDFMKVTLDVASGTLWQIGTCSLES